MIPNGRWLRKYSHLSREDRNAAFLREHPEMDVASALAVRDELLSRKFKMADRRKKKLDQEVQTLRAIVKTLAQEPLLNVIARGIGRWLGQRVNGGRA